MCIKLYRVFCNESSEFQGLIQITKILYFLNRSKNNLDFTGKYKYFFSSYYLFHSEKFENFFDSLILFYENLKLKLMVGMLYYRFRGLI